MMDRRIRVLHVIPSLDVGGMENGVVNVINGLPAARFDHHVACLLHTGPLAARLRAGVDVTELHAGRHDPTATWRLARCMRRYRPHVIHARNWSCWPDAAVARRLVGGGRLVWSIHGWTTDQRMSRTRALACRQLARWTDALAAVCRDAAASFAAETGVGLRRFDVLYNGVDADRFRPSTNRDALRGELGFDAGAFIVGAVGRLDPIKNYGLLLDAVATLRRTAGATSSRPLAVWFVGDGPEEASLRERAKAQGVEDVVRLLGRRSDVPRLLAAMDVFVLTSLREGMSNAILEAMACGVPVIATDVGGNREMIVDGRTGWLIESGDAAALASAIGRLAGDAAARRAMGECGRERVESMFSLPRMMDAYARTYERLAGGQGAQA